MNRAPHFRRYALAMSVVSILILGACSSAETTRVGEPSGQGPQSAQDGASRAETVRIAISDDEANLTPYTYRSGYPGYYLITLLYDTLLWHDANNEIVPWLATDYTVSPDGLTIALDLAERATWHDGTPLTAEDVKFTYDYISEFDQGRFTPQIENLESVTTEGPLRVVFRLSQPNGSFLKVPLSDIPIMPAHIWRGVQEPYPSEKALEVASVGTGPYKLVEHVPDRLYRLEANPNYFRGAPSVDELLVQIMPDANAQFLALRSGEIDMVAEYLPPELVGEFEAGQDVAVAKGALFETIQIEMLTTKPPFDDPRFRRAVGHAIDVEAMVEDVLAGLGSPGSPGWVHPESVFYKEGLTHDFDPERAATLLDEIGFLVPPGSDVRLDATGRPLEFDIIVNSSEPVTVRAAEVAATMLQDVGMRVSVAALTTDAYLPFVSGPASERDFDFFVWDISSTYQNPPIRGLEGLYATGGLLEVAAWSNEQFDSTLEELEGIILPEDQRESYTALQDLLTQGRPVIPLFYPNGAFAYNPNTYSGWTYVSGNGILDKISFIH